MDKDKELIEGLKTAYNVIAAQTIYSIPKNDNTRALEAISKTIDWINLTRDPFIVALEREAFSRDIPVIDLVKLYISKSIRANHVDTKQRDDDVWKDFK